MRNKKSMIFLAIISSLSVAIFCACHPLREFYTFPSYKGVASFEKINPIYDPIKKTIFIVADNEGTEIFDLMAPFCIFNATQQANVYIVAEKKYPITIRKGLFLLPHFTFSEIDSLKIQPTVMVIPALSAMDGTHQNPHVLAWIKKNYTDTTKILSVCVGSLTAAATGLYDGQPLTTHASEFESSKEAFKKPTWVTNVSITEHENLFSTAGVSNAVEGSLLIVDKLFGKEVMKKVMDSLNYPHSSLKLVHESKAIKFADKLTIANKFLFNKNKNIGVLLYDGIDEFNLASVLDTYHRTFPASIKTFSATGSSIKSKYGLTLLPTGNTTNDTIDELHILSSKNEAIFANKSLKNPSIVTYDSTQNQYMIDQCLKRISNQYGTKFENIVRLLLDYN